MTKQAEELLAQLKLLEAKGEEISDEEFHTAVKAVVDQGIATERHLAKRCRVSIPTIDRWQRITAPHPSGRKSVVTALIEQVQVATS